MRKEILEQTSIFEFDNYRDYLVACGLPEGKYGHSASNLKAWAGRLGYKSPSSLSMILSGERFPSKDMVRKIAADFNLSNREENYFELLIDLEKARLKGFDTSTILTDMDSLLPEKTHFSIGLKEFSVISAWYVVVIKQLIQTSGFIEDPEWIYKRLRKKVTPSQIKTAINNLLDLGIVGRDKSGRLINIKPGLITSNDVPSSAIKRHHFGMLERAQDALLEQPTSERQINSTTMKIKKRSIT